MLLSYFVLSTTVLLMDLFMRRHCAVVRRDANDVLGNVITWARELMHIVLAETCP